MIKAGFPPLLLVTSDETVASHKEQLIRIAQLPKDRILSGKVFSEKKYLDLIKSLNPDYFFSVHYPYIIRSEILKIPKYGALNLHPSFLPYNKGWHTPSWAIQDETPAGATLHFMSEKLDEGDIIAQIEVPVLICDTANTIYRKIKKAERELFRLNIPALSNFKLNRNPQNSMIGTSHNKKDLFESPHRKIDLEAHYKAGELLKRLRAFTTNNIKEGVYFEKAGSRYHMQITIKKEDSAC